MIGNSNYLIKRFYMAEKRWKKRPEGSNWGDFGVDDQLGRLNFVTTSKVKQGVRRVEEGLSFCLSLPLDLPGGNILNPRRHGPVLRPTLQDDGRPNINFRLEDEHPSAADVINDDAVIMHLQYSTQWDSLAHVGQLFDANDDGVSEPVFYNGFRAGVEIIGPTKSEDAGAAGQFQSKTTTKVMALGIENMALKTIQGKAVMVDLEKHFNKRRELVGYDKLMKVVQVDQLKIEKGDLVCLHTGFASLILEMNGSPDKKILDNSCAVLDGRDQKLLNWITETGLSALIADNYAVEALPATQEEGKTSFLPLHEHCLFKLGIPLGELWYLTQLAEWLRKNNRSEFLLTAPPLRLPGAVGSPTTPVATV